MAHFLEHLVFKGGEKYPTYRDVNEAAERIGAVLNAYTSHDLVAFHITARAARGARGRRPAHRLRRPAARSTATSSTASAASSCRRSPAPTISRPRGRAPDRRGGVRRSPARPAGAGSRRAHPRHVHPRGDRRLPRAALVAVARRGVRRRQPRGARRRRRARRAVRPLPRGPASRSPTSRPRRSQPRIMVARARLQPVPPADVLPPVDRCLATRASAPRWSIYATLLGGSMGSRLFDEIREQRGLAYSVSAFPHAYADVPILQLSAGLESGKCVEAYRRMRDIVTELRDDGPDRGRGRARAGVRRRRPHDRVREHRGGRPIRRPAGDRLRRGRRSRRVDRAAGPGDLRRGARGRGRRRRRALGRRRRPAHRGGAGDRLRRWIAAGSALVVAVAAVALAVLGSLRPHEQRDVAFDAGAPVSPDDRPGTAGRAPGSRAAQADPAAPGLTVRPPSAGVRGRRRAAGRADQALRQAGPTSGALVYDIDDRAELFGLRATVKRPPASVEKLWTTVAR